MARKAMAIAVLLAFFQTAHAGNDAGGKTIERTEPYLIRGTTGAALYASIGQEGPVVGNGRTRAIAYTDFRLTWRRRYENRNGGCVLASAVPTLTLIYRLPKPASPLPPDVQASWDRFQAGIVTHESRHGAIIRQMVARIRTETVGIHADNDPKCEKVHSELYRRLGEISADRNRQNADFDKQEMSPGGNVQKLVLALVNGP